MEIVKRRDGTTYHQAMSLCPQARSFEFRRPVELANPQDGDVIVDFPSGGSYLGSYLHQICPRAICQPVEHVSDYLENDATILRGTWQRLPFADQSVAVVLTLAALHHLVSGREAFYSECHRVIRPRGCLIVADVEAGTPVDAFLSRFVDRYSSEGHEADFITRKSEAPRLEKAGFDLVHYAVSAYHWTYPDRETAIRFCRGLFRLDLASDAEIWQGLSDYLGVEETSTEVRMNWQLAFARANRIG